MKIDCPECSADSRPHPGGRQPLARCRHRALFDGALRLGPRLLGRSGSPPTSWWSAFPGQFRNWFYALLSMSTMMENVPPFKTLLGHALVRDEEGQEMHKSTGNTIWFDEAAERMGCDVMRWIYCRQNPVNNLNFGWHVGEETRRKFFNTLWNVYAFFCNYARLDGFDPAAEPVPYAERQRHRPLAAQRPATAGARRQRAAGGLRRGRPDRPRREVRRRPLQLVRAPQPPPLLARPGRGRPRQAGRLPDAPRDAGDALPPAGARHPVRHRGDVRPPRGGAGRRCARQRAPDRVPAAQRGTGGRGPQPGHGRGHAGRLRRAAVADGGAGARAPTAAGADGGGRRCRGRRAAALRAAGAGRAERQVAGPRRERRRPGHLHHRAEHGGARAEVQGRGRQGGRRAEVRRPERGGPRRAGRGGAGPARRRHGVPHPARGGGGAPRDAGRTRPWPTWAR